MKKDKTTENYVKLMKAMARIAKKKGNRLMIQRCSTDSVFKEIVYLTDSCAVFPIPADVYDANAEACKCPTENNKVDVYKIIRDTCDKGRKTIPTRMLWELKNDMVVRVFKTDIDYLFANTLYTDLIDLLPNALHGSECYNEKTCYPIAFYNSNIDMGYAICPIYKGKNGNSDFETCLHDLEKVSYADVE